MIFKEINICVQKVKRFALKKDKLNERILTPSQIVQEPNVVKLLQSYISFCELE